MVRSLVLAAAAAMALVLVASCADEEPPRYGDLAVRYRIGSGASSCAEVDVSAVRVSLMSAPDQVEIERVFPCDPADQTVLLKEVKEGSYLVRVEALDESSAPVFSGELDDPIEVRPSIRNGPYTVVLTALSPTLQIWIGFGGAADCLGAGVEDVRVVLYENGQTLAHDESYDCASAADESVLIEELSDAVTYDLRIRASNEHGEYTHEFDGDEIALKAGQRAVVIAELSPCPELCGPP